MLLAVTEDTFQQEVMGATVPVVVSFWAPWCGVCRLVDPILLALQKQYGGLCKSVSVNADQNFRLANSYRLTTLPTLLVIHHGTIVERLEGFQGRDVLQRRLEKVLQSLRCGVSV